MFIIAYEMVAFQAIEFFLPLILCINMFFFIIEDVICIPFCGMQSYFNIQHKVRAICYSSNTRIHYIQVKEQMHTRGDIYCNTQHWLIDTDDFMSVISYW